MFGARSGGGTRAPRPERIAGRAAAAEGRPARRLARAPVAPGAGAGDAGVAAVGVPRRPGRRTAQRVERADRYRPAAHPADRGGWRPLGRLADLPDGDPVRRDAGGVPVFVLRRGERVTVLADSGPHLSAPLSEGELTGDDGDARIVCPWHGSEFSLTDGCVGHGPATAAVPLFAARVVDGGVRARIVQSAGAPTL
ncbi:Rieske (2Fe-2S) protein [Pseudonocardia sp. MH-G8]|uniref:Rieske (2Fe-2S) protein n=1 Tax=Pseudonocardia sp. MH-G8 TaxID=1854588 RepID=UPI0018E917B6|nr:Rieske (2Fe-2S) protein [Pseudonocardia sp. MH-G8]